MEIPNTMRQGSTITLAILAALIFALSVTTIKGLEVARTCEGTAFTIGCQGGKKIEIREAIYGRDTKDFGCGGPIKNTSCKSNKSLSEVKKRCNGKPSCSVPANNGVFGDPCRGTKKFLSATYVCKK